MPTRLTFVPLLLLLVLSSSAGAVVTDTTHISTGDLNGNAVTFRLTNSIDTVTGEFAGTFEIEGDPTFLAATGDNFFAELTIPPWDLKLLFEPAGAVSIYELSGFEFSVETDTTFIDDAAGSHIGFLSVAGDATAADYVHTFSRTTSAANGASRWTAVTNFFPLGPGLVGFDTVHLANGATPFSETTGQISLEGSPAAVLESAFRTDFDVVFAFTDSDPDDGRLAGTLEGHVTLGAAQPVPLEPWVAFATAAALVILGVGTLATRMARVT
jgi:hypothetical protein